MGRRSKKRPRAVAVEDRISLYRPTWAEIDLGKLFANLRRLKRTVRSAEVMFVVKADAYGHGAVPAARCAERSGAVRWFGVSAVEEGIALREAGIIRPILILGSLYPFESTLAAIRHRLTPTVASLDGARLIAQAAEAMKRLEPYGMQELPCHLKIDTGMGRIGVRWPALDAVRYLERAPGVRLEGVYTHLSRAENDAAYSRMQLKRFREAVRGIEALGVRVKYRHAANSAAALRFPESRWDLIRPGLAAYGLYGKGMEPVMSLKTRIVFLKNVPAGTSIGYGSHFRTKRASRIATLPIGYGDGLPRLLSVGGRPVSVLVRGRRCGVAGALSMDMMTVDVTKVPGVHVGDEVVIIGRQNGGEVAAHQLAAAASTIPYEIVTGLKARIPRVYLNSSS